MVSGQSKTPRRVGLVYGCPILAFFGQGGGIVCVTTGKSSVVITRALAREDLFLLETCLASSRSTV